MQTQRSKTSAEVPSFVDMPVTEMENATGPVVRDQDEGYAEPRAMNLPTP
jgi:hypothetical protein